MEEFAEIIREGLKEEKECREVYEILEECDQDFLPPLSSRNSTFQADLGSGALQENNGVTDYFEEIRKQTTLLIKDNGRTIAFISYRTPYSCDALKQYPEICYLTTMCVRHTYRGKGLSVRLYRSILDHIRENHPAAEAALRTWSTNQAQMYLMPKLGFECVEVIKDDRGRGVDTMYFVFKRQQS